MLRKFCYNQWYFDCIYNALIVQPLLFISNICKEIDIHVIDYLGPGGISKFISLLSYPVAVLQNGSLYRYIYVIFYGFAIFVMIILSNLFFKNLFAVSGVA